jgi:hypothetical protein
MASSTGKMALFIDGANLYATTRALGFEIDFKRLLKEFQDRGTLLRAFYYTAIIEEQEFSTVRPLVYQSDGVILRRWRLPPRGRSGTAAWRACHRHLDDVYPVANDRRRIATPGRRLYRPGGFKA